MKQPEWKSLIETLQHYIDELPDGAPSGLVDGTRKLMAGFRQEIMVSKQLAQDTEAFLAQLEKLLQGTFSTLPNHANAAKALSDLEDELKRAHEEIAYQTEQVEKKARELSDAVTSAEEDREEDRREVTNSLQDILRREPDATLRKKLERFIELLETSDKKRTVRELATTAMSSRQ